MSGMRLHERFESRVSTRPGSIAVSYEGRSLSYSALNARANELAARLLELHSGNDMLVGVCTTRSPRAAVAMLGVLKAGGAYLPMDPTSAPAPGAKPDIILTEPQFVDRVAALAAQCVCVPDPWAATGADAALGIESDRRAGDSACVLYPRDLTGPRRGVLLEHRNICSSVEQARRRLAFHSGSVVLSVAGIDDPVFLLEMFLPLVTGGSIRFVENLLFLDRSRPSDGETMLFANPAAIEDCLDYVSAIGNLTSLVFTNALVPLSLFERVGSTARSTKLFSVVAHAETSGWTAGQLLTPETVNVYAETPDGGNRLVVLEPHSKSPSSGAEGEVYVTGPSLARGYLDSERGDDGALVAAQSSRAPLFPTGYIGGYNGDNAIRFTRYKRRRLWSKDRYVHADAIEAQLTELPGVREAAVVFGQEAQLTAYVTLDPECTAEHVANALSGSVPQGFPSVSIVAVDRLPVTEKGGVDYAALAASTSPSAGDGDDVPHTHTQESVAAIWARLLGKDRILLRENFFDVGANSFLATIVCGQVLDKWGIKLSLADIYNSPNVEDLAERIETLSSSS